MRKLGKRLLVITLTFILSFNVISSNYEYSQVNASASAIGLAELIVGIASSMGVILPIAGAVGGAALSKAATDAFVSYATGIDSSEVDVYDRLAAGAVTSIGVTSVMVNDVKGWLETLGIESTKTGAVAEKKVSISAGELQWYTLPYAYFGFVWLSGSKAYIDKANIYEWDTANNTTKDIDITVAYVPGTVSSQLYYIMKTRPEHLFLDTRNDYVTGYAKDDAKQYFADYFIKSIVPYSSNNTADYLVGNYYIFEISETNWKNKTDPMDACTNIPSIVVFPDYATLKKTLQGDRAPVSLTIPSIGTYDEKNLTDLTDGRTLSAADLQAIADAINNPYADYKNSDGAITQEDLQTAVTAAIAAALAAAGEKEEPDNPTDNPVISAGFQGVFDWFQKVFDLLKSFFATATTFVTTFPLKLWRDALETFPATLSNIQNAVGDVFKVGEQIAESLTTFPTAESLKDLITGVPVDLADLKDAVTVFPQAFQDAMTGVITDVFPAALIDALEDALPKSIISGVATLPLSIVDLLIPELDLSFPKALEGSLPKILTDALQGSITIPDIKVDFPTLEIPNYMAILNQILAAILSIPELLTLDIPIVKTAFDAATKDVALETGVEPILALFQDITFDDTVTYPVIEITTPDILKQYYTEPTIVLLDFEDYAKYCLWARNIFRVTLWLAFLYWCAKQLQVHYHLG